MAEGRVAVGDDRVAPPDRCATDQGTLGLVERHADVVSQEGVGKHPCASTADEADLLIGVREKVDPRLDVVRQRVACTFRTDREAIGTSHHDAGFIAYY